MLQCSKYKYVDHYTVDFHNELTLFKIAYITFIYP